MWRPMYEPWPRRKQRESNNMRHAIRSITRTGFALLGFLVLLSAGCSPSASTGGTEGGPIVYTDAEFDQLVKQADHPVLVDFSATWCPPCKRMKPILAELEQERERLMQQEARERIDALRESRRAARLADQARDDDDDDDFEVEVEYRP